MKKLKTQQAIIFLFLLINSTAYPQTAVREYIRQNAVELKTTDISDSNFTDLEQLGTAIGEARIVSLGEQMHGDGTAFEAKGRIIKYLHEKKGFNVLVFESDYFGLTNGFAQVKKSRQEINTFIFQNLIAIWGKCNFAKSFLYDYLYKTWLTSGPLVIAGMDCQIQTDFSFENMGASLKAALQKVVKSEADSVNAATVSRNFPTVFFNGQKADPSRCEQGLTAIRKLNINDPQLVNPEERILLESVRAAFESILPYLQTLQPGRSHRVRDVQMFNNLMWLANHRFPKEKLIVWAHNAHIAKSVNTQVDKNAETVMLGHLLGDKSLNPHGYYALGFTSYNAESNWTTNATRVIAQKPSKESFESWINKKWNAAFVDWGQWNRTTLNSPAFSMKGSIFPARQHQNFVYAWNKVFDGIFFLREIKGCEKLSSF